MAGFALSAQPRELTGPHVGQLRRSGLLPGVAYGPGLEQPINLQFDPKEFELVYRRAGTSQSIDLTLDGRTFTVVIKEAKYNLLKRAFEHVDLYAPKG